MRVAEMNRRNFLRLGSLFVPAVVAALAFPLFTIGVTPELIFGLFAFVAMTYALRLLGNQDALIGRLLTRNTELLSAIEWRDEVIANLEDEGDDEPIDVAVDCGCPRCRAERWAVN